MVRVVNDAQPRRCHCKECFSELEYTFDDVQRDYKKDHVLSMTIITSYIICPICKEMVRLGQCAKEWD